MIKYLLLFHLLVFTNFAFSEEIKIGLPVEVSEIDPYDLNLLEESEVFQGVHDSLLSLEVLAGYSSSLAQSWEFDKEKKTIKFHLRKDSKFSDGSSLTAKDVAYSFRRIIALDAAESYTLTKCLQGHGSKYSDPKKPHPLINVLSEMDIVIGPTPCGASLLTELSSPNYGIISERSVGSDLKLNPGGPYSGAFSFKKNGTGFNLIPNLYNWRWSEAKNRDLTLRFFKIDQDFDSISRANVDIFRTSKPTVFEQAIKNGFKSVISVPIMVWFLAPDYQDIARALPIINSLNANISNRKYSVFKDNPLETSADSFFPKEFNCDFGKAKKSLDRKMLATTVRLVNHKSKESNIYVPDLKDELEKMGLSVLVDDENKKSDAKVINLYLKRQFLGDGILISTNFAFRTAKSIPDPHLVIISHLKDLDMEVASDKKQQLIGSLCRDLHFFNHVPLAHRKYGFLYKTEMQKLIFSKGNGNLNYNLLIR